MRIFVLFLSLSLLGACAGFQPVAPERQRVFAGEVSSIPLREPPPEGAQLRWSAGDGSEPVEGRSLAHAWQRPGVYTVAVEGSGGRDSFEVEVLPRPVVRAIPADVRLGVAVPAAWSRFAEYAALASRFAPAGEIAATLARVKERLGADPAVPAELVELGIDPAEGVGLAIFPFDPDASWILVGILDEEKALATVRRLFGLESVFRLAGAGGDLYEGISAAGERQLFGVVGGYLVIRGGDGVGLALAAPASDFVGEVAAGPAPGFVRVAAPAGPAPGFVRVAAAAGPAPGFVRAAAPADPAPGFVRVAASAGQAPGFVRVAAPAEPASASLQQAMEAFALAGAGLSGSASFEAARALAPGDDAIFYMQTDDGSGAPLPIAVGVEIGASALLASYGVALAPRAIASASAILDADAPPGAALTRYPAGAVAYLGISFDPAALFQELVSDPMERALFGGVAAEATGVPIDQLIAGITGNLSAGLYFDPEAFTQVAVGLIGGGDTGDDAVPPLYARVELRDEAAQAMIERALDHAAQRTADGWWQRGAAFMRPSDGVLEIATMRARHLRPKPEGMVDFAPLVPGEPGTQSLYVDVAGILEGLRRSEAESAESAVVRALLLEEAAFLEPIRSVLLHGRMAPGGTTGTLRVELQPE